MPIKSSIINIPETNLFNNLLSPNQKYVSWKIIKLAYKSSTLTQRLSSLISDVLLQKIIMYELKARRIDEI